MPKWTAVGASRSPWPLTQPASPHPASEMHTDVCHGSHREMGPQQRQHSAQMDAACVAQGHLAPFTLSGGVAEGLREVAFAFPGTAVAQMPGTTGQPWPTEEESERRAAQAWHQGAARAGAGGSPPVTGLGPCLGTKGKAGRGRAGWGRWGQALGALRP